jgi:hypothetical protein
MFAYVEAHKTLGRPDRKEKQQQERQQLVRIGAGPLP